MTEPPLHYLLTIAIPGTLVLPDILPHQPTHTTTLTYIHETPLHLDYLQ